MVLARDLGVIIVDNGFLVLVGADNKLIVGMSDTVPEGFSDVSVQIGTFFIVPLFDKPEPAVEFVLSLPGRDFFIKKIYDVYMVNRAWVCYNRIVSRQGVCKNKQTGEDG